MKEKKKKKKKTFIQNVLKSFESFKAANKYKLKLYSNLYKLCIKFAKHINLLLFFVDECGCIVFTQALLVMIPNKIKTLVNVFFFLLYFIVYKQTLFFSIIILKILYQLLALYCDRSARFYHNF